MKRIIVACNNGVATSQTIVSNLENMLEEKGVNMSNVELLAVDIDAETDSIYFYSICSNCEKKKVVIGRKREYLEINDAAVIVL